MLILLGQPNVLVLDEPTNDLDTDMLTALEDLLDTWPGTLIVVSHDRYFLERVTDQQYALIDGHLRHLPGGVDEYLRLRAGQRREERAEASSERRESRQAAQDSGELSGAEQHEARKKLGALERRIDKLQRQVDRDTESMAAVDPSDYVELGKRAQAVDDKRAEIDRLENEWLELGEQTE